MSKTNERRQGALLAQYGGGRKPSRSYSYAQTEIPRGNNTMSEKQNKTTTKSNVKGTSLHKFGKHTRARARAHTHTHTHTIFLNAFLLF